MTATNEEPRSAADIGSVAPARRLPPASPTAGGPAGFSRGRRSTTARGRVSRKMPFLPASSVAGLPAILLGGREASLLRPQKQFLSALSGLEITPFLLATPAVWLAGLAALFLTGACLADLWRETFSEATKTSLLGPVLIATRTACPPSCWAGETLLETTKTNLLRPFLIATRTRDVTSQLPRNQHDRNF
jgi:hypothetical protein